MPERFSPLGAAALLSTLLLTASASAQTSRALILENDIVFPLGPVKSTDGVRVADNGEWLVFVEMQQGSDPYDLVLLRNGIPTLQGGNLLGVPEGAQIDDFGPFAMDLAGNLSMVLEFMGYSATTNSGIYFGANLLIQESWPSLAPQLTPGSQWKTFSCLRSNDARQILCLGAVDDPNIPSTTDHVIVRIQVDEDGNLASEECLAKEGDLLPDGSYSISRFSTTPRFMAFNGRGDVITFVDTDAPYDVDGSIYFIADGEMIEIAQEGDPSPVPGRPWEVFSYVAVDLNDYGDYVLMGDIAGDSATAALIVRNDEKFVQEGDPIPAIGDFPIQSFYRAPLFISNGGDVVWFCQVERAAPTENQALFQNDEIVARRGITRIEGEFIRKFESNETAFHVSPNGRFLIYQAELLDWREGAFMIDLGCVVPMPGCRENEGKLTRVGGLPFAGETIEFAMSEGQAIGVLPIFLLSTHPAATWPPCGIPFDTGELLIDFSPQNGNPAHFSIGPPWGGAPVSHHLALPDDAFLIGATLYMQGLFWDVGDQVPEVDFRLTNGMMITIASR